MFEFLKKLLGFKRKGFGLDIDRSALEDKDERNFILGGSWNYQPKQVRVLLPTRGIRDQKQINSCVLESIAVQKEQQEGTDLSAQVAAAYLRSLKVMGENGTSLDAGQKMLIDFGMAERRFEDDDRRTFYTFTRPTILTEEVIANAGLHKGKSYWRAPSLGQILEQIDEGRIGQTGCIWYDTYTALRGRRILQPFMGQQVGGHAFAIVGYDTNFNGEKVVILQNSFGEDFGDKGFFYIRFRDFEKVCTFAPRYSLDIDKDKASWLSLHSGRGMRELNSPRVYLIEGDRKRYIPDIGLMLLLGINHEKLETDTDNMLLEVPEGNEMTIEDVPPAKVYEMKRLIQVSQDDKILREIAKKYFPDILLT